MDRFDGPTTDAAGTGRQGAGAPRSSSAAPYRDGRRLTAFVVALVVVVASAFVSAGLDNWLQRIALWVVGGLIIVGVDVWSRRGVRPRTRASAP